MKICPVCKKDEWTYLRCYRVDCTDGRILIEVKKPEKEEKNETINRR